MDFVINGTATEFWKKIFCLPWRSLLYKRSFLGVWETGKNRWNISLPCHVELYMVCLWRFQKGNTPLQYIPAHFSKIYGLDWSPNSEFHLVTASQDCYVRVGVVLQQTSHFPSKELIIIAWIRINVIHFH